MMKKSLFAISAILAIGSVQAQTTLGVGTTVTTVQGSNIVIKATSSAAAALVIDTSANANGILMGNSANPLFKVDRRGDLTATTLNANSLTMSNGGTISGTAQVVTIDAVGNGNVVIKDSTQVQGNITATQTISSSQAIQTTGTGSINSAYNLTAAGNKFNVAGDTGNVSTTGSVTAATGNFGGAGVGSGLVGVGAGNKIVLNGNNGNAIISGVTQAQGGLYVGPRADSCCVGTPSLQVNGAGSVTQGATDANGNVADGSIIANGTDLTRIANKTAVVQTNLDAEVTDRKAEITRVDGRIDVTAAALATETATRTAQVADLDSRKADKVAVANAIAVEENARIAGDVATLNSANAYTDARITNQSGADRAYTDKAVAAESSRAQAAEAALSKETKQVGAMAMAAAGVAGATPAGDKKTAATVALGSYSGQTAIAVGVSHLIKENARVFGAFSKVRGGKTGVTVGASFSF